MSDESVSSVVVVHRRKISEWGKGPHVRVVGPLTDGLHRLRTKVLVVTENWKWKLHFRSEVEFKRVQVEEESSIG